jgi:hypothetical protein
MYMCVNGDTETLIKGSVHDNPVEWMVAIKKVRRKKRGW